MGGIVQVTEAAAFVSVENGHRVAMYRDTWPEANVRKQPDGHLQFFRHINSVISWPWSPTVEDLLAENWFVRNV